MARRWGQSSDAPEQSVRAQPTYLTPQWLSVGAALTHHTYLLVHHSHSHLCVYPLCHHDIAFVLGIDG